MASGGRRGSQVIENLVRNATDAVDSDDNEQPEIRLATRRCAGDEVELSVSDNGPGIALLPIWRSGTDLSGSGHPGDS